ncbi:MAG: ATP-dependent DNA helicase RecQ [Candidatus Sericytochromatia bacterium]|nr:ATP-dependent DNA helicase RecQ [Candidatus Sericytochromatia bacterium]
MPAPPPHDIEACLRERFGLSGFREGQREVIDALLAGRSTLAVMPTGRGKSLCYQLPALLLPGVTVVVSPLIALMKDQVDALEARGIPATFVNSSLDPETQAERLEGLVEGTWRLLYVAPERFRQRAFLEALRHVRVSLLAIDEAHCLSQWGHDFRPDYLKLRAAREACGDPVVLAATATATPEVRTDVIGQLGLRDPHIVVSGFDRPNLRYVVRHTPSEEAKAEKLLEILDRVPGAAIVYAATRKNVEAVTERLVSAGIGAVAYHAGLGDEERAAAQERFMAGRARVVVATNAFGMGIDKPDVRAVVHHDLPGTLEAYYQEAGRAGRDGHPAYCVLLYSPADRYLQEFFIEGGCPRPETVAGVYRVLAGRPEQDIFLSQEAINRQLPHKAHDMAVGTSLLWLERAGLIERLARGASVAEVRMVRAGLPAPRSAIQHRVLEVVDRLPGVNSGAPVELGALAATVGEPREAIHHALLALRARGVLDYIPPARTRGLRVLARVDDPLAALDLAYIESKQARELARLERMVGFATAPRCRRNVILDYFGERTAGRCGRCDVCLDQTDAPGAAPARRPAAGLRAAGGNGALYDSLVRLRGQLAREQDVPAYKVFSNQTLEDLAAARPTSLGAMLAVKGVGPEKLSRYGSEFLGAILAHAQGAPTRPLNPRPTER